MSDSALSLDCHGKINLFLEVQDKRSDGYHNLGTLFHTVGCSDRLTAEPWETLDLECPDGITAEKEQNLVYKAARALRDAFAPRLGPNPPGVRFTLEKRLPSGAGLGGGSSDAAAALLLCNRLWKLGLTEEELLPVAAKLGADVPFFLSGGSAFGEGKGEILKSAPAPYPFHIVIGTPHCRVETAWAYGQLDPDRRRNWSRFRALYLNFFEEWEFYHLLQNDFDPPMTRHFEPIRALGAAMREHSPVKTLLCGSGASVFSLFKDKEAAEKCEEEIRNQCRFSCVTGFVE
jgi:4-diphosphocytidyl-2-C-methyl-D-erythritol kinase